MKRLFKILLALVLGCALILLIAAFVARDELVDVPNVHAAFYAKETCSCLYVIGQKADYCRSYGLQLFLPSEVRFDEATQTVGARTFWGAWQTARFVGAPYGCKLDPWPQGA